MRVLLTGYSGFLGRYLARVLKKEGFYVRVLLHRHTVCRADLCKEVDEVLWGSLDDHEVIKQAVRGVQIVIHSGWNFSFPSSLRPTTNEKATELLFKESIGAGVTSFVFISSVAVYGMSSKNKSLIKESSPLATGEELSFIYPSEKINIEHMLQSSDKKMTKLGIFRPGPIFGDKKGPIKKIMKIAGISFGMGLGNGRNRMAYIHAEDVANAVVMWLKKRQSDGIFNVTPTLCMRHKDWYRSWGRVHGFKVKPIFIRSIIIRLGYFGVRILKKILGKQSKGDVNYAIACATRDKCYSNEALKTTLGWADEVTSQYT